MDSKEVYLESLESLECHFCKKSFSTKSSLNSHQKTAKYCLVLQKKELDKNINNNINSFVCNFCDRGFTLKKTYQDHLNVCKKKGTINLEYLNNLISIIRGNEECIREKDETIREKDIIIKQKDEYISKIEELLKESNVTISEIAKQPSTSITNSRIKNTQQVFFDINDIQKISKVLDTYLTPEVLCKGQEGLAEMLTDHLLKNDNGELAYECSDISRQKFRYINKDGNIQTDPKAANLIRSLDKSGVRDKAHNNGKKLWEKEDGTVNYDAQTIHMPKVMELLDINNDSTKFRSRLASITNRQ